MEIINEQNNKIEYNFGLLNIGNTCYANSAFQLLFTIEELREYILDDNNWEEQLKEMCIKKGISKDEDVVGLIKQYFIIILYKFLTIPGDVKNPTCLFSLFKYKNPNSNFNIREQNDSHEFLNILIDNLEEEFYKLKNIIPLETEIKKSEYSSILSDLLNIQYDIKLTNTKDNEIEEFKEKNNFLYLHLSSDQNKENIQDLINKVMNNENIKVDESEFKKEIKISNTSKYLLCYLTRFIGMSKNNKPVDISKIININNKKYEIVSIISHSGSTSGGHYVNYSKRKGEWYLFNDSSVHKMSEDTVINNVSSGSAYIMLYKLIE